MIIYSLLIKIFILYIGLFYFIKSQLKLKLYLDIKLSI